MLNEIPMHIKITQKEGARVRWFFYPGYVTSNKDMYVTLAPGFYEKRGAYRYSITHAPTGLGIFIGRFQSEAGAHFVFEKFLKNGDWNSKDPDTLTKNERNKQCYYKAFRYLIEKAEEGGRAVR